MIMINKNNLLVVKASISSPQRPSSGTYQYYLILDFNTYRETAPCTTAYPISTPHRQAVLPVSQHYALLSNAAPLLSFSRELRLHHLPNYLPTRPTHSDSELFLAVICFFSVSPRTRSILKHQLHILCHYHHFLGAFVSFFRRVIASLASLSACTGAIQYMFSIIQS